MLGEGKPLAHATGRESVGLRPVNREARVPRWHLHRCATSLPTDAVPADLIREPVWSGSARREDAARGDCDRAADRASATEGRTAGNIDGPAATAGAVDQ